MFVLRSIVAVALAALCWGCEHAVVVPESIPTRQTADNGLIEWAFAIPDTFANCDSLEFEFLAEGLDQFDTFEIKFKSGKGRYCGFFNPGKQGQWNRVLVRRSDCYKSESEVKGWNVVSNFTLSGQRDRVSPSAVRVRNIHVVSSKPEILVVRPDSATKRGNRNRHIREACVMTSFLSGLGVEASQISDVDIQAGVPSEVKLLVFPDNPFFPTNSLPALQSYAANGGKFLAMCEADRSIAKLVGYSCKPFYDRRNEPSKPRIAGLLRTCNGLDAQPNFVPFRTNCLMEPRLSSNVVAIANWADQNGNDLGFTGIARTPRGFCYSSDWRIRDTAAKSMMRAMLLEINPAWKNKISIKNECPNESLKSILCSKDEIRAVTCHKPYGLYGRNWDESIKLLKECGFNTLIVNVAWGGVFYEEEAKECLKACRNYGISCHFWKVCWRIHQKEQATHPGRKAVGTNGVDGGDWMCPADPINRALELKTFERMAALKPDGIMLDYIRYNNGTFCCCDDCKRHSNDKKSFFNYRREMITSFVREVSHRIRSQHPEMKILASVIANTHSARDWFGQDWTNWAKDGLVDIVCPMNYYLGNSAGLRQTIVHQQNCCGGAQGKVAPCLGLTEWPQLGNDSARLAEEVKITRELNCGGFVVFDFTERFLEALQ